MAKTKTTFVCTNCGVESAKWVGKCPSCGEWNSYVEELVRKESTVAKVFIPGLEDKSTKPVLLNEIESSQETRIDTSCGEFNRVLGGGLVPGS